MSDPKNHNGLYLSGKLLLASPTINDPRFERAVIFMCAHDENGAMGLTLTHTLSDIIFDDLLTQIGIKSDINVDLSALNIPVMQGGPVDPERGFFLHSNEFSKEDTIEINDTFRITGTIEALHDIAQGKGPDNLIFALGYAGWDAGQLDQELQQNAWLVVDADLDLVFKAKTHEKWTRALNKIGIDPAMLSSNAGRA